MLHSFYIFLSLVLFLKSSAKTIEDDKIITEAENFPEETKRTNRQIILPGPAFHNAYNPFLIAELNPDWNVGLATTGACLTSKGFLGRCVPFRQCYPYFKLPEFNNWESWILGMYDTCSYYTPQGRQVFGVCCSNPIKPILDQNTEPPIIVPAEIVNSTSLIDSIKNPQISNWPPPIPTHPPDHTIPPLPTHPPLHGYPTHPPLTTIPSTSPTQGTQPSKRPTRPPRPSRPPTKPSTTPASYAMCGAKNGSPDQERIVGGHNADVGEWPWIAALFNGGRQFCGGSLIDNIHILSAAHCVAHMSSWDVARLTVRLGDYNIKTNSEVRHIEKRVKRIVRHRGFDGRTLYNDIAILTLDSPVEFTQQIRPICLPSPGKDYVGKTGTVIGWGSLRESGPQPSVLQEVNIPIWSNQDCRLKYGHAAPGGIVEHMICAGQASRDSCSGDSGGPLMVYAAGKWVQVGIVSWGIGCGKGQYPGVYTRVERFLPWINKNLK